MQKPHQDEFLEFNSKHSDILQIFLHKNKKKHWRLYSVKPILALSMGCQVLYMTLLTGRLIPDDHITTMNESGNLKNMPLFLFFETLILGYGSLL